MKALVKTIPKFDMKLYTVKKIAEKLIMLMEKHIGEDDAISKRRLFSTLFRESYDHNNLKHFVQWEFTKRAMHMLRTKTKCFVISKYDDKGFSYFVPTSDEQSQSYINTMNKNIRAMTAMKKRIKRSIDERWFSEEWILPTTTRVRKLQ